MADPLIDAISMENMLIVAIKFGERISPLILILTNDASILIAKRCWIELNSVEGCYDLRNLWLREVAILSVLQVTLLAHYTEEDGSAADEEC